MEAYKLKTEEVIKELNTSVNGLSSAEAEARLLSDGKNVLSEGKKHSLFIKFILEFNDVMTLILIAAAGVSGIFGEIIDMSIILVVVILNAVLGVVQEAKAEAAIEALKKLSVQKVKVKRDGKVILLDSENLVKGDLVLLEAGDSVSADIRIIQCHSLQIEEAALTGESVAVEKHHDPLTDEKISIGDKKNMGFMGTNVTYGRGEGIVVETGMGTQMGKIADMLNNTKEDSTPLQKQLDRVGKILSVAILVICLVIFSYNLLFHGRDFDSIINHLMLSVSLAVAAIPEGLTAVVTLVLALGVTRMSKKNAIIRKMPSIETLGCAEVICSDKTGTLTQNKMTVVETYTFDSHENTKNLLLRCAVLANDSFINGDVINGDPTETALVAYALKDKINKTHLEDEYKRLAELPFDSVRKLMSTANSNADKHLSLYTKGAPDQLISRCTRYLKNGEIVDLDEATRKRFIEKNNELANKALRVLAFAYKPVTKMAKDINLSDENDLIFIGLMGMIDPIRPEVKDAVHRCLEAGIRPIMITGDHLITAVAIGRELGLIDNSDEAITGKELDNLSDEEFAATIQNYSVYARVSPENKVRIVKFWRSKGKICAMTGDGVNDAPALKTSDIGVGMGITGTDVTKNVADIVLADDNFNTIVIAVEEGRKIYANIQKTVQFLLSSNVCEVLTLFIATIFGLIILTPVQILWVNLVTDTIPALGLGLERAEEDIMQVKPRDPKKSIFADGCGTSILYQSVILTVLVLTAYYIGSKDNHTVAMTMAFFTLSISQIFHSFNLKSMKKSILNKSFFNNKTLVLGSIFTIFLTTAIIYIPGVNTVFGVQKLTLNEFAISMAISFMIIPLVEVSKYFINLFTEKN